MTIYIDTDYRCHTVPGDGLLEVETKAFDGKCSQYIEGYRFVPEGRTWTREDGVEFAGEMIAPALDYSSLALAQAAYEEAMAQAGDMEAALEVLGVTG